MQEMVGHFFRTVRGMVGIDVGITVWAPQRLPIEQFSIVQIDDEIIALNTEQLTYHTLNRVAYDIWLACDGTRQAEEIRGWLIIEHPSLTLDAVEHGIAELAEAGMLETRHASVDPSNHPRRRSRRTVLAGIGAAAVPVIASITAPEAGAQNSGLPLGAACGCSFGNTCCASGCCLNRWAFPCNGRPGCEDAIRQVGEVCVVPGARICLPGFPDVCVPSPSGQCK